MAYTLQCGQVLPYFFYLLGGALVPLELAFLGFIAGFAIGLANAASMHFLPGSLGRVARVYVILFLNTPLLVQIFFIFFGLPEAGILIGPFTAVLIGIQGECDGEGACWPGCCRRGPARSASTARRSTPPVARTCAAHGPGWRSCSSSIICSRT